MSAKAISPKAFISDEDKKLECPHFKVYHFVMLDNKQLSDDEAQELLDHIAQCEACKLTYQEVKAALNCESKPSRKELITYLQCLMDQVTGLNEELHDKFLLRHRIKVKKRLARSEKKVRALESTVAQLQAQVQLLLTSTAKPPVQAFDDLECSELDIHHFLMSLTNELSGQETEELTDHLGECKACENAFEQVQNIFTFNTRPSRKEQLVFLSNLASPLWTSQVNKLKAELLIMKGASTNATN